MPQSLANLLTHIVFSTKERRAMLQNPGLAMKCTDTCGYFR